MSPTLMSILRDRGLVELKHFIHMLPMSKASWHRGVIKGTYPKPIVLSPKINVWNLDYIISLVYELTGREYVDVWEYTDEVTRSAAVTRSGEAIRSSDE